MDSETRTAPGSEKGISLRCGIVIAEDDPIFRRVLERSLSNWNYDVQTATNGREAWELLQHEGAPKLVVLDWMMPGMDGPEVCRKLRALAPPPYRYIVLLTARGDKQDMIAGLEAGADDYLVKPFDPAELRARLRVGQRILDLQDQLIRAREALCFEATHDPLTGLWNRAAILDILRRELERSVRANSPVGVLMIDVDHFKRINDTCGHLGGDKVLHEVAQRFVASVRAYDWVGRYGGEEFLIIIPNCGAPDLVRHADRLRRAISDLPLDSDGTATSATVSIGVTAIEPAEKSSLSREAVLRAADVALYEAKRRGRNRVELATAGTAA